MENRLLDSAKPREIAQSERINTIVGYSVAAAAGFGAIAFSQEASDYRIAHIATLFFCIISGFICFLFGLLGVYRGPQRPGFFDNFNIQTYFMIICLGTFLISIVFAGVSILSFDATKTVPSLQELEVRVQTLEELVKELRPKDAPYE